MVRTAQGRPIKGAAMFIRKVGVLGTFLGVPIIRTIVFWGLYWGPPILGNYQVKRQSGSVRLCPQFLNVAVRPAGPGTPCLQQPVSRHCPGPKP